MKNNPQELQYFCSTIEGLKEAGLLQFLENIENELVNLRSIYTDKDPKIKLFLKDRDIAVKTLKERSISYLKAKRKALEAEKEASMRPKGVILKYKELLREANRNEKTLVSLENQLKQINLESEVQPTPWELITKPTLNQFAVEPNKRTIALSGLIIGFFLSMAIVIFKEKRSGLIYEEVELENILNTKVIKRITFNGGDIKEFEYESPFSEILYEPKKIINMIYPSKNINQDDLEKIQNAIPSFDKKIKFVDLNRSLNELENIFLILSEKLLTYNEINSLHDRLELSNKKIKGIILIK